MGSSRGGDSAGVRVGKPRRAQPEIPPLGASLKKLPGAQEGALAGRSASRQGGPGPKWFLVRRPRKLGNVAAAGPDRSHYGQIDPVKL